MGRRRGSRTGGFIEPATASFLTLAGVGAVSGYGANSMNADQQAMIDEKVRAEVANIQSSVGELETLRKNLETTTTEKQRLEAKLRTLEAMIETLKKEKSTSSEKLQKVQSEELLFRNATSTQKKKAFEEVKSAFTDEAAKTAIDGALASRSLGVAVAQLTGPTGKTDEELRKMFVDALVKAPKLVEEDLAKKAEDAKKAKEEAKAKKAAEVEEAKKAKEAEALKPGREKPSERIIAKLFGKKPVEPVEPTPVVVENPIRTPEEPVMTPNPMFTTTPDPTVVEVKEPVTAPALPSFARRSFDETDAGLELPNVKLPREMSTRRVSPPPVPTRRKGGARKKKLRTRRGVKQNVRRTRSG